jgi:hypothetical protein
MVALNNKTSLLVPYQLPEYIRDNPDYSNFVVFLQAYYEWMELNDTSNSTSSIVSSTSQGPTFAAKNLSNYFDIDNTVDGFLNYFVNDFLPYFPEDALTSKDKAVKVARQLYKSKGTPASYQFLFRVLYNSDFDFYNTDEAVLKSSTGTWFVPKSLKLATDDNRFLQLQTQVGGNYRVFGETSKSFATIEYVTFAGNKTEIFISNIERLFQSGEMCRIVDAYNQDIIINGTNLRAKLVGQISSININPNNRGLFYNPGDPVVVYGGLSPDVVNPVGATAEVGQSTSGSVQFINLITDGYGYSTDSSVSTQPANTAIAFTKLNPGAKAPIAIVGSVDPSKIANVAMIPIDSISLKSLHYIGNIAYSQIHQSNGVSSFGPNTQPSPVTNQNYTQESYTFANNLSANANTTLANALSFISFSTYPLSSVVVESGGGGITTAPTVQAESLYGTDVVGSSALLSSLGVLGPIQIVNAGSGYVVNDTIKFNGGAGYGAYANVTNVDATGAITGVNYVFKPGESPHHYPLGGMGYNNTKLPILSVVSQNTQASNASLYVPAILGTGATFSLSVDRAGSITTINITNPGEDYVSAPSISLRVQDIIVANVPLNNFPDKGDILYQGTAGPNTASYYAYFDSLTQLTNNLDTTKQLWNLRVYNYSSQPKPNLIIKCADANDFAFGYVDDYDADSLIQYSLANTAYAANSFFSGSPEYNSNGVKNYGDGTALATAKFLNGLAIGQGQYLTQQGQPSGFSVLQNVDFNSFTYQITVEKEIQKYRSVLLNLLHPSGTHMLGRYSNRAIDYFNLESSEIISIGHSLYFYTQTAAANVQMLLTGNTDPWSNAYAPSTNIVKFNNLSGANLGNIIFANTSTLALVSNFGETVSSIVTGVDHANNIVTLSSNVFLGFTNVASASWSTVPNTINITSLSNTYNIINNGNYSNTSYPMMDIIRAGDTLQVYVTSVSGNTLVLPMLTSSVVSSVDYINNIVHLTNNLSFSGNSVNGVVSIVRSYNAGGTIANSSQVIIYNTQGV